MKSLLESLQKIGGALMLPIAVLPIAGLLLRLGQADLLNIPMLAAAGEAIFSNLGLLFAIGVAVGLARENHGAAGLASAVCYLIATQGAQVLIAVPAQAVAGLVGQSRDLAVAAYKAHELSKLSVPAGILSGLTAGALYNRFSGLSLPSYLSFFGGRRFVPIVSGCAGLVFATGFGLEWQPLEAGMDALSRSVLHAGALGLFAYGVLNRVLIVTGLHHIINNIAWFLLGDYHGVTGDLKRFFAGDPTAGAFMSGFFPVMMFGLPAACLAMYHTALPERRRAVGGLLGSIALTSLLTGVTEPIEFTFMFLAPVLYAVHALLTGVAFVIMNSLQVRLGFGFSAGLIDYVLNFSRATRPWLLLPVGLVYFALYYGLFRWAIVKLNLRTPGRDPAEVSARAPAAETFGGRVTAAAGGEVAAGRGAAARIGAAGGQGLVQSAGGAAASRGAAYVAALGGAGNLVSVDACTTRLRLVVAAQEAVDAEALKELGARGLIRPAAKSLQVVIGTIADQVAGEIRNALKSDPSVALLAALGGRDNVLTVDVAASRLRIGVVDSAAVDAAAIRASGLRGVALPSPDCVHIIVGPTAKAVGTALDRLLGRDRV